MPSVGSLANARQELHNHRMPRIRPAPDLAARLAAIELEETSGERLALGRLWDRRPLLLIHLRHFG
jgi:hypothetical protein